MHDCTVQEIPAANVASGVVPGTASSPGFQFGRPGPCSAGDFLQNPGGVVSNESGILCTFDGTLVSAWVIVQVAATFSIDILKRVGAGFTTLATISVVANRVSGPSFSVAIANGDEIAAQVSGGSCAEISMGLIIGQNP